MANQQVIITDNQQTVSGESKATTLDKESLDAITQGVIQGLLQAEKGKAVAPTNDEENPSGSAATKRDEQSQSNLEKGEPR